MKLKVGDKDITIRKWKGKDKKKFSAFLKSTDADYVEIMKTLVYDCIEEDVALSTDEFKYVLSRIRALSLGEDIEIEVYCSECGAVFKKSFQLKDVIRATYTPLKEIKVNDISIKLGEVRNPDFYIKKIADEPDYDFLLRIHEFNGSDTFTLDELESMIDNIDIDTLTEIMKVYENHKFKIDDINIVKCKCGKEQKFMFDEIPGFLPNSWFQD